MTDNGRVRAGAFGGVLIAAIMVLSSLGLLAVMNVTATHSGSSGTVGAAPTSPAPGPQTPTSPPANAVTSTAAPSPPLLTGTGSRPGRLVSASSSTGTLAVGNNDDWVGVDPNGTLGSDSLTFSLSNFGGETDICPSSTLPCNGRSETNAYSLQINSNRFPCNTTYTGGVNATCWEQFVYSNCPNLSCIQYQTLGYGAQENIFIEYWLLGYLDSYPACPSTGIPDGGQSWKTAGNNCFADTTHLTATGEPPSNLGNLDLTATANGSSDTVTLSDASHTWSWSETDNVLDLSAGWTRSEANVFGFNDLSQAEFGAGTSITVTSSFTPGPVGNAFTPRCVNGGTTGETNNLYLGPCTTFLDGLSFTETTNPSPSTTQSVVLDNATQFDWTGFEVTGASAFDTATVTTASGLTPTGNVTYELWTNGTCSGPASATETVTLGGGHVPPSTPTAPLAPGNYSYAASYNGDANTAPSTGSCEPFTVLPLQLLLPPGLSGTTVVESSGDTVVSLNGSGGMVAQVILPPGTTYPNGSLAVTFNTSVSGGITNNIVQVSGAVVPYPPGKSILVLADGNNEVCIVDAPSGVSLSDPPSCISTSLNHYQVLLKCDGTTASLYLPDGARNYTCSPVEVGGTPYLRIDGLAHSFVETLTKGTPTISSVATPTGVVLGASATDLANVSGGYAPSGTVTYTAYSDAGCSVQVFNSTEPLGTSSAEFTPSALGLYEWIANYSGNVNNYGVATACGADPLGVFDFNVSLVASGTTTVAQGGSLTMTVSVSLVPGSATIALPAVPLTLSGLPSGVVAVGFPTSLSIGDSQVFTVETATVSEYVSCPNVTSSGGQALAYANLSRCDLAGYDLSGANLKYADLEGANLAGASLVDANLVGADLASANTTGTDFQGAHLEGADLTSAGPLGNFLLTANGTVQNISHEGAASVTVAGDQLSGDNFEDANLKGANLTWDLAVGANFTNSNLKAADLQDADLQNADLQKADLAGADLQGTNLTGADLTGARF